jgi:glyoxylate/hydroxypyruvate reductase A
MSILLVARNRDLEPLKKEILRIDSNTDVEIWPNVSSPGRVQFALAWNHPEGVLNQYPNLKAVSSLGAGVDHLLNDTTLPSDIRITRIVGRTLTDQMSDYIQASVLNLMRHTSHYIRSQQRSEWAPKRSLLKKETSVGIMGLGELGMHAADRLAGFGFDVTGWSRRKKDADHIRTFGHDDLTEFLGETNILICMLPLTPATEGILDLDLFKKLKKPAFLINVARGQHLVDEDLIYALDTELLMGAVLDVFSQEPLPDSHPFWNRENITITPHVASVTDPAEAAGVIVENYKRLMSGMNLLFEADREAGY